MYDLYLDKEHRHIRKICRDGDINIINSAIDNFKPKCVTSGFDEYNRCLNLGLLYACESGCLSVINLMIDKGADKWNTGLCYACKGGI